MDRKRWILIPPAIWIASLFLIQILGSIVAPDSSEMPEECPEGSQNCARVLLEIDASPQDVQSATMYWIMSQDQTTVQSESESDSHTVFRTRWMMFQDDFFVETGCTENTTWIQIHSESRLGVGDMGVNQARINTLIDYLSTLDFEPYEC